MRATRSETREQVRLNLQEQRRVSIGSELAPSAGRPHNSFIPRAKNIKHWISPKQQEETTANYGLVRTYVNSIHQAGEVLVLFSCV